MTIQISLIAKVWIWLQTLELFHVAIIPINYSMRLISNLMEPKTSFLTKRVDIVRFGPKGTLMILKYIYRVKKSSYLYSGKNFLLYPMWDVINTLHADTTFSLYPMRLWGQTNK